MVSDLYKKTTWYQICLYQICPSSRIRAKFKLPPSYRLFKNAAYNLLLIANFRKYSSLTLFDMGGGGGMMVSKIFLTTVLKCLGGGS